MPPRSARRLRDEYRKQLDSDRELKVQTAMRVFRDALMRRNTDPEEIATLCLELENRLRGKEHL